MSDSLTSRVGQGMQCVTDAVGTEPGEMTIQCKKRLILSFACGI